MIDTDDTVSFKNVFVTRARREDEIYLIEKRGSYEKDYHFNVYRCVPDSMF